MLIDNGITDPDIARQMLLDYLAILQQNLKINTKSLVQKLIALKSEKVQKLLKMLLQK